jgi:hypothetical protein
MRHCGDRLCFQFKAMNERCSTATTMWLVCNSRGEPERRKNAPADRLCEVNQAIRLHKQWSTIHVTLTLYDS